EQHRAIFISGHAIGAIVSAGRQIAFSVITPRTENFCHFSVGRRILTHHVANHVTEPEDAGGAPDRTLGKGEPIGELFKLGVFGYKSVKRWVKPHNASHRSRFFRCGSGRGGSGTSDDEKCTSEDQR